MTKQEQIDLIATEIMGWHKRKAVRLIDNTAIDALDRHRRSYCDVLL